MKVKRGWNILIATTVFTFTCLIMQGCASKAKETPVKSNLVGSVILDSAGLKKFDRKSLTTVGKKGDTLVYSGVSLAKILDNAGLTSRKLKPKEMVNYYVVATGADGFTTLFSLAEIDTAFGGKEVIVADQVDEKPLSKDRGPYQLVALGDKRPTRNCYQLVRLDVYDAKTVKETHAH